MYFLLLILFSCLPKIKDFEPSGSMCMDALQINLMKEGCVSVSSTPKNSGIEVICNSSNADSQWSKKIFYITSSQIEEQLSGMWFPICVDKDMIVYVLSE